MNVRAKWLKETREKLQLSQAEFSTRYSISARTLQRAEAGENIRQHHWRSLEQQLGPIVGPIPKHDALVSSQNGVLVLSRVRSMRVLWDLRWGRG